MKRALITPTLLTLLCAPIATSTARAEETLGARVDKTKNAVTQAAEGATERARETAQLASERAAEVAEQATEKSHELADTLSERAHDVAESAKELASELVLGARAHAEQLGERTVGLVEQGKAAAGQALQGARDEARAILISAAVALDNKSREARLAARRASWAKLKVRFSLAGDRPTLAMSEELRDHEYRIARLERAQELARAVNDQSGMTRSAHLLEAEYARHMRRVVQIRDHDRAEAKR